MVFFFISSGVLIVQCSSRVHLRADTVSELRTHASVMRNNKIVKFYLLFPLKRIQENLKKRGQRAIQHADLHKDEAKHPQASTFHTGDITIGIDTNITGGGNLGQTGHTHDIATQRYQETGTVGDFEIAHGDGEPGGTAGQIGIV